MEILEPNKELDELCAKLGVKRGRSFRIKLANHKKETLQKYNECPTPYLDNAFVIMDELLVMGDYDEGFGAWYGGNDHVLKHLKEGLLVVNREQTKKTSLA